MLERRSNFFAMLCVALCVFVYVRFFDDAADERTANESGESDCRIVLHK